MKSRFSRGFLRLETRHALHADCLRLGFSRMCRVLGGAGPILCTGMIQGQTHLVIARSPEGRRGDLHLRALPCGRCVFQLFRIDISPPTCHPGLDPGSLTDLVITRSPAGRRGNLHLQSSAVGECRAAVAARNDEVFYILDPYSLCWSAPFSEYQPGSTHPDPNRTTSNLHSTVPSSTVAATNSVASDSTLSTLATI